MKKTVCSILAVVLTLMLCSCGVTPAKENDDFSVTVKRADGVTETFTASEFSNKADANDYAFNNTYKGSTIELTDKVLYISNQSNKWLLITTKNDYFFSIDVDDYPTQANQITEGSKIRMTGRITQDASSKVNVECDTLEVLS